jgi:hypothetical protein
VKCEMSLMCIWTFSIVTAYTNTTFRQQTAVVLTWLTEDESSLQVVHLKTKAVCFETSYLYSQCEMHIGDISQVTFVLLTRQDKESTSRYCFVPVRAHALAVHDYYNGGELLQYSSACALNRSSKYFSPHSSKLQFLCIILNHAVYIVILTRRITLSQPKYG